MGKLKKTVNFLVSMKFAIILLLLLISACVLGSVITQNQTLEWYTAVYSERKAALIKAFLLDDVFHSWWFIVITAFLCLNLLFCNLTRLPSLLKRFKREKDPEAIINSVPSVSRENIICPDGIEPIFQAMKMPVGKTPNVSSKNHIGIFGAWISHLGILLLIVGFAAGQMTKKEYSVYGLPGDTKPIGDTGYNLTINDFRVELREDDTVKQYTSEITVKPVDGNDAKTASRAEISVNHPASLFGLKFYQNSTGYAAKATIKKDGEVIQEDKVAAGDYIEIRDREGLVLYLNAFYPDFQIIDGNPVSISDKMNNPAYLYSIYYQGEFVGMNALLPGEEIKVNDYVMSFSDPTFYTVIQVKRERFTGLVFAGALITLLGLFLAFYIIPVSVWGIKNEDGTWNIYARCVKKGTVFSEEFNEAVDAHSDAKSDANPDVESDVLTGAESVMNPDDTEKSEKSNDILHDREGVV